MSCWKWVFFKFATGRPAGRPSESAIGNMRFRTVRFWQPRPLFLFFGKHFNHPHPLNFDWMFLQLAHGASAFLGCSCFRPHPRPCIHYYESELELHFRPPVSNNQIKRKTIISKRRLEMRRFLNNCPRLLRSHDDSQSKELRENLQAPSFKETKWN